MAAIAFLFALVLASLARIAIGYDHNEQMYVAAGWLVARGLRIYADFAFLQMPYLPLLYGTAFRLFAVDQPLLAARIIAMSCYVAAAVVLAATSRRQAAGCGVATAVAALFLLNPTIVKAAAESSNYVLPVLFSYLSFHLFSMAGPGERARPLASLLCGGLLGLAVGTKLYYAPVAAAFLGAALLVPRSVPAVRRLTVVALPLGSGIALGLLPALLVGVPAPASFWFGNVGYHLENATWREITGYRAAMTLSAQAGFALHTLLEPANLVLLVSVAAIAALALAGRAGGDRRDRPSIAAAALASGLTALSLLTVVVPRPIFPQYLAMPVSFLVLAAGAWAAPARRAAGGVVTIGLATAVGLTLVVRAPDLGTAVRLASDRDRWPPVQIHSASSNLRAVLAQRGATGKVATLAPLIALDSGLAIYPELATGPFLFRVGDLLTGAERARYRGSSPDSIGAVLDADPPAAIVVGPEGPLDAPLRRYARKNGYLPVAGAFGRATVYVRPVSPRTAETSP